MLVRRTYRDGAKVRHETLANLSALPAEAVSAIEATLRASGWSRPATLTRNQVRFTNTQVTVPMLTEPTSTQRQASNSSAPPSRSP